MTIRDYVKVLRTRWITICVTIAVTVLGAISVSLLTTPLYEASTRLFVSTMSGASGTELYQGNRFSQERVISYTELLMGKTLAQRTIDKLGLDMSAKTLQEHVKASAKPDTVLIDVAVRDGSPVRARDIANVLADEFVAMVRKLETPESGSSPDARVVVEERASIPDHPVVPKTARNISIGLALGLALGVCLAVVRDLMDNTVKDRETIEEITGVGLVGSIPLDKDRRKEPAISFVSDDSAIAESFRKLRTNLQFLAVDDPPRVIVVASSMQSEGKSTTAINIALALAEAEHDVVLVDGDLRRPSLDKYLHLVGTVGFSTVLADRASLDEALQETRFPRLRVLTSGAVPPNPSELLGSLAAKKVLNELRGRFDFVVIDSSPLLAVTDAAILAAGADGVLIIARSGQTKREQLTHAVGNIEDVGARLLGAVFTMTPMRGDSSYNYSYSYYGNGNGRTSPIAVETVTSSELSKTPLQDAPADRRHTA
ncbi:polysaccharide biosynthesis tyrosine autokinase [Mycobacterium sp. URHB0044]|uniref:polysaccharide biosynthesis tyrosine autokinase n=1 Tax=Mycobacterium sp. URHB0044 TaxID=1380386 RepID=UPI0009DFCE66|nr:polysaccharide biosynthesis tyrosine autokinase [Mycobacterium sp. URHB0044]